ncbi:hypothetical protein TNCV_4699251 [Trichonephila clavipes]|nr:hypothetical protein TNCV_4699251 [Trichonephila clavipes]
MPVNTAFQSALSERHSGPNTRVMDLVDRRLARDPRLAASKDELFTAHTCNMGNSLPQTDIQIYWTPYHVV